MRVMMMIIIMMCVTVCVCVCVYVYVGLFVVCEEHPLPLFFLKLSNSFVQLTVQLRCSTQYSGYLVKIVGPFNKVFGRRVSFISHNKYNTRIHTHTYTHTHTHTNNGSCSSTS